MRRKSFYYGQNEHCKAESNRSENHPIFSCFTFVPFYFYGCLYRCDVLLDSDKTTQTACALLY